MPRLRRQGDSHRPVENENPWKRGWKMIYCFLPLPLAFPALGEALDATLPARDV